MNDTCLKNAVLSIHMPGDMEKRIIDSVITVGTSGLTDVAEYEAANAGPAVAIKPVTAKLRHPVKAGSVTASSDISFIKRKLTATLAKPAAAVLAAVLSLTLSLPVLAATVTPVYELLYQVSPSAAQFFQPVRKSDEDNGIKMEVLSAYVHGDTAEVYIAMQDLTGDRIDETTDLYDSYSIHTSFDSSADCERIGYDEKTATATFLVSITQMGDKNITGDKITFSVTEFLSHKTEYKDIVIPAALHTVTENAETREVTPLGFANLKDEATPDSFQALIPGAPDQTFPLEGVDLTGMAFVHGALHIQTAVKGASDNDSHGYFYLTNADGDILYSDIVCYFSSEGSDDKSIRYMESVFSVTPEELAGCTLYATFTTSGLPTRGNWKVTFPLEQAE